MQDEFYMRRAIELAKKGMGYVNPNPLVGAVIVKKGKIIGEGYHEKYGGLHAERNALAYCTDNPQGAEMYVTLEPCCHYGMTPPCTDAIIAKKIARVTIGCMDPNPIMAGKGAEELQKNGIQVKYHVLKYECESLNEVFFHYIQNQMPFVAMKYAMTLDGKIATCTGKSKWITGEASRGHVHSLRNRYASIMVGINTVLVDDPILNCRMKGGRNPIRIICDTNLRIPLDSNIVKTSGEIETIIVRADYLTDDEQSEYRNHFTDLDVKEKQLTASGCKILKTSIKEGHVDLRELMKKLGHLKIDSILLEGGGELNYSALRENIVNKVYAYISPKIFGGGCKTPVGGKGVEMPEEAFFIKDKTVTYLGDDILIEGRIISDRSL